MEIQEIKRNEKSIVKIFVFPFSTVCLAQLAIFFNAVRNNPLKIRLTFSLIVNEREDTHKRT
jgi:hypothetical protein